MELSPWHKETAPKKAEKADQHARIAADALSSAGHGR
jgi:hypothetical protein